MHKKANPFITFFVFLFLTLAILVFAKTPLFKPLGEALGFIIAPFEKLVFKTFNPNNLNFYSDEFKKLKEENLNLKKLLVDQKGLMAQNKALNDQFLIVSLKSQNELPANIIGAPSFIPGFSPPDSLILDKGEKDRVEKGQAVIVKDNLIGKIANVSKNFSTVELLTSKPSLLTVKTMETSALGIIKGDGGENLILDNVLLSEKLKVGDLVLTKGDQDINGKGIPPGLIVGEISSVDKKPSSLFQSAKVKGLIRTGALSTVFIIKPQ